MAEERLARYSALNSLRGLLSILFALFALVYLLLPQFSLVLVFAVYALLEGTLATLGTFQFTGWPSRRWMLLLEACLNLTIGVLAFAFPPLWSIALPWLIAGWAILTGLLLLAASIRSPAQSTGKSGSLLAGAIRLCYGGLAWFLPWSLPNIENMSGRFVVFLVLTSVMAILFGVLMIAWELPHAPGSTLIMAKPNDSYSLGRGSDSLAHEHTQSHDYRGACSCVTAPHH